MHDAEALDLVAVFDHGAFGEHLADDDEHASGLGGIPHESARDGAFLHQLAALTGRERPEHEDFAAHMLLFDRPAGADRALPAEGDAALDSRMALHHTQPPLAPAPHIFLP